MATIQFRLWIMAATSMLLLATFAGIAIWGNHQIVNNGLLLTQLSVAKDTISNISKLMSENRTQVFLSVQHNPANEVVMRMHDHPLDRHLGAIAKNRDAITASVEKFNQLPIAKQFEKETIEFTEKRNTYVKQGLMVAIDLLKAGQFYEANAHAIQKVNPLLNAALPAYDTLMNAINEEMTHVQQRSDELSQFMSSFLVIGLIVTLIISFVLAWLTIRAVKNPIELLSKHIEHITQRMSFDAQLPQRTDEFRLLTDNANHLFSQIDSAIKAANRVLNAIGHADFNQCITDHYVGDLDQLKQGINNSAASVAFMMNELSKVMESMSNGKFDIQMDKQVPTAFRQTVEQALNRVHLVIEDINSIMAQMNQGDFNGRVTAQATGDLEMMKNNINNSVNAIADAISAISVVVGAQAAGDLTKELPSGSFQGQLHDLKNAINYSSNKVRETVEQAIQVSNIVSDAAAQVSQGAFDLSGRVQEMAASLEETSATMSEMSSAVEANTQSAKTVASLAKHVQQQACDGVNVMQQTITAMQAIRESSTKIADIVSLIDGIAFQTNLLALNAAVEAARAGEHGRGFAVVAGEVRALAQKSASAAKDIKLLIDDSVQRIEKGTQLADKSGEMLGGITGEIERVATMAAQIASASSEQTVGIHQVHRAISDIDRVTQENAALVEETNAAAESLSHEAQNLKHNMGFFQTNRYLPATNIRQLALM